jgi:Putative zinc-RING and/or ribbon
MIVSTFQLSNRQHFVDNADMFSLQDLVDLANDVLLPELTRIHASLAQHIKSDCQVSNLPALSFTPNQLI